jgi:hypothetical protein
MLLTLILLIGCSGPARVADPLTPTPIPPPTFTPTASSTLVPTTVPTQSPPVLAATPPVAANPTYAGLVDPEPGPTTLATGAAMQDGRNGYAAWCVAGGKVTIYDTFGRVSIPTSTLPVAQGSVATFTYRGADPVREIIARLYPGAPVGTPPPPGQFIIPPISTGTDLPVTQTERTGAITFAAPPGEYILFVNVHMLGGGGIVGCSAQYQFRVQVT